MVDNIPFMLLVGCALGFLSGLGVGGGSLLMLWLTLVAKLSHGSARSINLLFFIPSALIASVFRWKQGALDIKKIIPAIIAGCITAAIFSILSKQLEIALIQKFFGILLLFTGLRELFYKPTNQRLRKAK